MTGNFSMSQYDALANQLTSGLNKLTEKSKKLVPTAQKASDHWYIPQAVADAIKWIARKMKEITEWICQKLKDALTAVLAPVILFIKSNEWVDEINSPASAVQGNTAFNALRAHRQWEGPAASTYTTSVRGQSSAAGQIASIAKAASLACTVCAGAGLAFYIALAAILVKVIAATNAALGALISGVGAPVAAAIFLEEAAFNSTAVWAAISMLAALLTAQVEELNRLSEEAQSTSDFPGGHWPVGTA